MPSPLHRMTRMAPWVLLLVHCASPIAANTEVHSGSESLHVEETIERSEELQPEPAAVVAPSLLEAPLSRRVRRGRLALGAQHSCLLDQSGQVYCWGANRFGQLGDGTATGYREFRPTPAPVLTEARYLQLESGAHHVCALTAEGAVDCWGHGAFGQLGTPAEDQAQPKRIAVAGVVEMALGDGFTCVLKERGQVECMGRNDFGQLGRGHRETSNEWARVTMLMGTHIAAGRAHICAVDHERSLSCWGENLDGQLGLGRRSDAETEPHQVDVLLATEVELSLGGGHSCLRTWSDGGASDRDASDRDDANDRDASDDDVTEADANDVAPSTAVINEGSRRAYCWGRNDSHQLGLADAPRGEAMSALLVPTEVEWTEELALGSRYTCRRDASLRCVGLGRQGQIGDGGRRMRRTWTNVRLSRAPLHVAAGHQHACAVRERGLWCWGANRRGQVGDGENEDRARPVRVRAIRPDQLLSPDRD